SAEMAAPISKSFPEDEPIFAETATVIEPLQERAEEAQPAHQEPVETATTSVDWNREFRRRDAVSEGTSAAAAAARAAEAEVIEEEEEEEDRIEELPEHSDRAPVPSAEQQMPAFAAAGTLEEETIDEEEAETLRYEESSDEGYEEFEEETRAAGQPNVEIGQRELAQVRETVDEIHMSSLADAGVAPAAAGESEEDSEELELEEAQAEAEAMLAAEAGGANADAQAEVRAPAGTASYTQRVPRPRPSFDRHGGGQRGRRGGRRFPRRESHEVPKISDLLKEGQEILVQIAKKGARITSHIALPGRFLVYMPTVNHTGVSRKIASDEERQRLKRIVM